MPPKSMRARDQEIQNQDPCDLILANTRPSTSPLVPEVLLHLADELVPLWHLTEEDLAAKGIPPPFWAFAWAGGQAIARYILDNPTLVYGKRVLDFAAGSGLCGIAAGKGGASRIGCADIDPYAEAACRLNAALNTVELSVTTSNIVGMPQDADVILAGDICYEQPLAGQVLAWLSDHAKRGKTVLIGDPGRTHLPKSGLTNLQTYQIAPNRELEDLSVRRTSVYRMDG